MQFSFEVGGQERHVVSVNYDQTVGMMSIMVDGKEVVKQLRMFSLSLTRLYEFAVGDKERHAVRIEKRRKLLLAGIRPQRYRVYVDGRMIQEHEGI